MSDFIAWVIAITVCLFLVWGYSALLGMTFLQGLAYSLLWMVTGAISGTLVKALK